MIPYIIVLLFVVIIILWQIYSKEENFVGDTTTTTPTTFFTEKTTLRQIINEYLVLLNKYKELAKDVSRSTFKPIISETQDEIRKIFSLDNTTPLPDISTYDGLTRFFETTIADSKWLTDTLNDPALASKLDAPYTNVVIKVGDVTSDPKKIIEEQNTNINNSYKILDYLNTIFKRSVPVVAISSPISKSITSEPVPIVKPIEVSPIQVSRTEIVTETVGPASIEYTSELEQRLAKKVIKELKDKKILERNLEAAYTNMKPYAQCDLYVSSTGMDQGSEFLRFKLPGLISSSENK